MRILIAEDDFTSRTMLTAVLEKGGHEIVEARDGNDAWEAIQQPDAPGLVILDWMMPEMDGLEVVRRVRQMPTERRHYIIMLTHKGDRADIVAGLEAGADDYLTKPFDAGELRARVKVGRRMVEMQDRLSKFANKMQTLAEERARQLVHADRLATLGVLAAGIAHEINNPVAFVAGNAQTIERVWDTVATQLQNTGDDEEIAFILEEVPKMLAGIRKGVDRISKIVRGLKSYVRQEKMGTAPFHLDDAIETALELCRNSLKYNVTVEKNYPNILPEVLGDYRKMEQVLVNLLTNAADAMSEQKQGTLSIDTCVDKDFVRVTITDNGPGMTPEVLDRMFDPFYTTKTEGKGTGLGLSISKGIIEQHGGTLEARNTPEGGAELSFTLPVASCASPVTKEDASP